jgi:hypothetical protein
MAQKPANIPPKPRPQIARPIMNMLLLIANVVTAFPRVKIATDPRNKRYIGKTVYILPNINIKLHHTSLKAAEYQPMSAMDLN